MTDADRLSAPRILVVADDDHMRGLLAAVLRAEGHAVDTASDRATAVAFIERHAYGVVLSDLRMPRLDGPELVRALEEQRPDVMPALIFLVRSSFAPDLARFLMDAAAQVLGWPVRPADISRVVARALSPAPA